MAQNGTLTREEAEAERKLPLGVNPRSVSPNTASANYFAEESGANLRALRREEALYGAACRCAPTLDPKMQAQARRALIDGLVRYDQARGWRGPQTRVDLAGRDWGMAVAEVPRWATCSPGGSRWCSTPPAAGPIACSRSARARGRCRRTARPSTITPPRACVWDRPRHRLGAQYPATWSMSSPGRRRHHHRLRPDPRGLRRHRGDGPLHGPRPRDGRRRVLLRRERVQPRHPHAPARLVVQPIVYSARRARQRLHPVLDRARHPDHHRGGSRQEAWTPSNYDGKSGGPHTPALRHRALEEPHDGAAGQGCRHAADRRVCPPLRRSNDDMLPVLPMSLGAGETTVMRMVTAYSMLANGGRRIRPTLIDRIQDGSARDDLPALQPQVASAATPRSGRARTSRRGRRFRAGLDPLTAYQIHLDP